MAKRERRQDGSLFRALIKNIMFGGHAFASRSFGSPLHGIIKTIRKGVSILRSSMKKSIIGTKNIGSPTLNTIKDDTNVLNSKDKGGHILGTKDDNTIL